MQVIGIAGGVASGKSFVAEQFRQLGAVSLDADKVAHDVLREPEVMTAVRERWGDQVFREDNHVDRAAVAKIVFGPPPDGPTELAFLERLVHPRIGERLRQTIEDLRRTDTRAVLLDAAVMFKAGWNRFCDKIVFVEVPRPLRLQRARQRGWSEADFAAREASQESLDNKREAADVIIDNSGSPDETLVQVRRFWQSLE